MFSDVREKQSYVQSLQTAPSVQSSLNLNLLLHQFYDNSFQKAGQASMQLSPPAKSLNAMWITKYLLYIEIYLTNKSIHDKYILRKVSVM